MDITATWNIKMNQLAHSCEYIKVIITVCSTSVASSAINLYFEKERQKNIQTKMLDGFLLFKEHTTK